MHGVLVTQACGSYILERGCEEGDHLQSSFGATTALLDLCRQDRMNICMKQVVVVVVGGSSITGHQLAGTLLLQ